MTSSTPTDHLAWPPADAQRLADVVQALAGDVGEPDVRAQIHAVAALLANLGAEDADQQQREALEQDLAAALAAEDEADVLAAVRRLARLNRRLVTPVDWTAVTGG